MKEIIVPMVLEHLEFLDLLQASRVCRMWHEFANKEIYRRSKIRTLVVHLGINDSNIQEMKDLSFVMQFLSRAPFDKQEEEKLQRTLERGRKRLASDSDMEESDENYIDESENQKDLSFLKEEDRFRKHLNILPQSCILFTKHNLESRLFSDVFEYFRTRLPYDCDVVLVEAFGGLYLDDYPLDINNNLGFAVFLPRPLNSKVDHQVSLISQTSIEMAYKCPDVSWPAKLASKLWDDMITKDDCHSCVFMFTATSEFGQKHSHEKAFEKLLIDEMERRYRPGKISLMGSWFNSFYIKQLAESIKEDEEFASRWDDTDMKWLFIRISGKAFKSWSFRVDLDLSEKEQESKLQEFKSKVSLNRNTIAFSIWPTKEPKTDFKLSDLFNEVFPEIIHKVHLRTWLCDFFLH